MMLYYKLHYFNIGLIDLISIIKPPSCIIVQLVTLKYANLNPLQRILSIKKSIYNSMIKSSIKLFNVVYEIIKV